MNQKDKELLLVDLCARLPYGVMVQCITESARMANASPLNETLNTVLYRYVEEDNIELKPYLRTMSSMTEEEWKELNCIGYIVPLYDGCFGVDMRAYCKNGQPHYRRFSEFSTIEDWLNAHHFDHKGLIEKGLAIEVTEKNNPYKR